MAIRLFALFCAVVLTIGSAIQAPHESTDRAGFDRVPIFKK